MSLYSILHKDTIVYDKFKHFINDPRFIALINDYLQSDIDKLNLINQLPPTEMSGLFLSSVVERLKADSLPKDSVL